MSWRRRACSSAAPSPLSEGMGSVPGMCGNVLGEWLRLAGDVAGRPNRPSTSLLLSGDRRSPSSCAAVPSKVSKLPIPSYCTPPVGRGPVPRRECVGCAGSGWGLRWPYWYFRRRGRVFTVVRGRVSRRGCRCCLRPSSYVDSTNLRTVGSNAKHFSQAIHHKSNAARGFTHR